MMKRSFPTRIAALMLTLLLLLPLFACTQNTPQSSTFVMMDTVITVSLYTDAETARPIFSRCREILTELDDLWARQKAGSDAARYNAGEITLGEMDPRTVALLQTAQSVTDATDGAFDVTVAPLVDLWQTAGEKNELPGKEAFAETMKNIGKPLDATGNDRPRIDLGGIGKGAAISILIEYLCSTGVKAGLVSFGSNVAVFGEKPDGSDYRIAVKDPFSDDGGYVGVLRMTEGEILSVSGDYERYVTVGGEKYHHIVDPKTGYPAKSGLSSVAVVCRDGSLADALSTALFVMGLDRALDLYRSGIYDFEAIFIASDGKVTVTDGIAARFEQTK